MTRKQRRRSSNQSSITVNDARDAVQQIVATDGDEVDPASQLFVEFAAPLLVTAGTEEEFNSAVAIAEFVWANSYFDAATQILQLQQFIQETGIPDEMVPWLMDIYTELAMRKEQLAG